LGNFIKKGGGDMRPGEILILIDKLTLTCRIGVPKGERDVAQLVIADIRCRLATTRIDSDELAATVDYVDIVEKAQALVKREKFKLLETLAEALALICFEDARVSSVDVTLRKPNKLSDCEAVGVARVFHRV
jgi:7,8-dihydroneopterin aldolase/epimerase/oxygenase